MSNSEEISAKDALEMIIRGQIDKLVFKRAPDWVDIHHSEVTARAASLGVELMADIGGRVATKWVPCSGIVRSANAR